MNILVIEHTIAVVGGIVVFLVAAVALWNDRKAVGVDNQVFKLMLFLLAVGAILAMLAGIGILGNFPKAA